MNFLFIKEEKKNMSQHHKMELNHRYLSEADCSSFGMCPQLALALQGYFLRQTLTVQIRQTRQAVCAINQSIFNIMSMN
jgi:hypothetical protein